MVLGAFGDLPSAGAGGDPANHAVSLPRPVSDAGPGNRAATCRTR